RGGRGPGSVRLLARRNAPVRRDLPGAQAQSDRPDLGAGDYSAGAASDASEPAGASPAGSAGGGGGVSTGAGGATSAGGAAGALPTVTTTVSLPSGAPAEPLVVVASVTAGAPLPSGVSPSPEAWDGAAGSAVVSISGAGAG